MEGIIFNIQRFSVHDGPGIRTTVFLKGCPLSCWWCHNPEGISFNDAKQNGKESARAWTVEELYNEINKDRIFFDESGGGVTFSGGEPLAQAGFLEEILKKCKEEGIHTAVDTSGYADREDFVKILPFTDLILYDLKLVNPNDHFMYTGKTNEIIIQNLGMLMEQRARVVIRIPLIPGITSTKENLEGIIHLLEKYNPLPRITLLKYHSAAKGKYERLGIPYRLKETAELPETEMEEIEHFFVNSGFDLKVGN